MFNANIKTSGSETTTSILEKVRVASDAPDNCLQVAEENARNQVTEQINQMMMLDLVPFHKRCTYAHVDADKGSPQNKHEGESR